MWGRRLWCPDATGAQCVHDQSGMIHPAGNAGILATHIGRLKQDRILLENLRQGVLAQRDNLTWAAAARKLEGCYEEALEARVSTRS